MKKILIFFTNENQLSEKFGIDIDDKHMPIKIKAGVEKFLYVLHDKTLYDTDNEKLSELIEMIGNNSKIYYVKHNETTSDVVNNLNNKDNIIMLEDHHEPDSKYYILLKKVHKKDNNYTLTESDFDEIWEKVSGSMLEATLNLLHGLLESKDTELPDELSEFKDDYNQFKNGVNSITDTTDESYIKALAEFRDALFRKILNV